MEVKPITRVKAIQEFFELDAGTALHEIRKLKSEDPAGFEEMATLCATALGRPIKEKTSDAAS